MNRIPYAKAPRCPAVWRIYATIACLAAGAVAAPCQADPTDAAPPSPPHVHYSVTEISPLPYVADETEISINDSGEISFWNKTADGTVQSFTWQKGKLTQVGTLPGDACSVPHDLNNRGDVVGWSVNGKRMVDSTNTVQAYLYKHGHMINLGTLGGKNSWANGVNNAGVVVGRSNTGTEDAHAFMYKDGKMTDLGTLQAGTFSEATGINDSGEIVGTAEAAGQLLQAVEWTNGQISDIGTLPSGSRSHALAVNNAGDIVGYSEATGGDQHAFLFSGGNGRAMIDLGDLGGNVVRANAINNNGQIVGMASINESIHHGFLWEDGKIMDLNDLIETDQGWHIRQAFAINDHGWIVCDGGQGVNGNRLGLMNPGDDHVLLLMPIKSE